MLKKQIPAWVSHHLPDPCQAENDRPSATCASEVREQLGGWGWELRAGDGLREAGGIMDSRDEKLGGGGQAPHST